MTDEATAGTLPDPDAPPRDPVLPRLLHRFVTAEAVYGLVLYAAVVAAASDEEEQAAAEPDPTIIFNDVTYTFNDSTFVFLWAALSAVVFWGAHVFAHAVAGHGVHEGEPISVGLATKRAFHHAAGMLYAPIVPSIPLLLGAFGLIAYDDAVGWALWTTMALLGVLGFLAFTARRSHVIIRILGGLGTAFLGLIIIIINAVLH